uniref:Uncharacterized protein n=1 Tax=Aegilops tauschii subsp. strangulata TaxID=200361 RepID=A0A453PC21_AEGTS
IASVRRRPAASGNHRRSTSGGPWREKSTRLRSPHHFTSPHPTPKCQWQSIVGRGRKDSRSLVRGRVKRQEILCFPSAGANPNEKGFVSRGERG